MYIVVGDDVNQLDEKYITFELDTIRYSPDQEPVTSYCVITNEHVPLTDVNRIDEFKQLHNKLLENYKKRNWKFCIDALEHLKGRFKGEMDSFYDDMEKRCQVFQQFEPPQDWDGVYDKTK
jgi:hypothetical protein